MLMRFGLTNNVLVIQLEETLPSKQRVGGSSPPGDIKHEKHSCHNSKIRKQECHSRS